MRSPLILKILFLAGFFLTLGVSAHGVTLNIDPLNPKDTYDTSLSHCGIYEIDHITLGTFFMGNVSVTKTIYLAHRRSSLSGKSSDSNVSLWRPGADEGTWPVSTYPTYQRVKGYDSLQIGKTYVVCYDSVSQLIQVAYYGTQEATHNSYWGRWTTVNDSQDLGFFPANYTLPVPPSGA
jgi:hypothetical protein